MWSFYKNKNFLKEKIHFLSKWKNKFNDESKTKTSGKDFNKKLNDMPEWRHKLKQF